MVAREAIFAQCWQGPVGDDSLNRVIAGLRKVSAQFGERGFTLETVRGAGYVLRAGAISAPSPDTAAAVWDAWQRDEPRADVDAIAAAEAGTRAASDSAEAWALLSLACRLATENCEPAVRAGYMARCQDAARRALALEPGNALARSALAGVVPIFGDWTPRRKRLGAILAGDPDCPVALHEMAILERSTGRLQAAVPLLEALLERFETAPALLSSDIIISGRSDGSTNSTG